MSRHDARIALAHMRNQRARTELQSQDLPSKCVKDILVIEWELKGRRVRGRDWRGEHVEAETRLRRMQRSGTELLPVVKIECPDADRPAVVQMSPDAVVPALAVEAHDAIDCPGSSIALQRFRTNFGMIASSAGILSRSSVPANGGNTRPR